MYIYTTGAYCQIRYVAKTKSYFLTLNMKGAVAPITQHHIAWETVAPNGCQCLWAWVTGMADGVSAEREMVM